MSTILTVRDALLADVLAHPAEDWPRLVLADWLEEHGGDPERAELIRVQMERQAIGDLARHARIAHSPAVSRARDLDKTIYRLVDRNGRRWTPPPFDWDKHTSGLSSGSDPGSITNHFGFFARQAHVIYHRGFIGSMACPLQVWLKHGPALVRAHPITKVTLTDRIANGVGNDRCWWSRANYDTSIKLDRWLPQAMFDLLDWWLPQAMFDLLEYDPAYFDNAFLGTNRHYPAEADAVAALSAAALAWAKQ